MSYLALLQFVAGILNLLPIPGFDGFGIIEPYLSYRFPERIRPFRPWIPLAVFSILFSVPGASSWLFTAGYRLLDLAGGSTSPGGRRRAACSGSGPEARPIGRTPRAPALTMLFTTRWWNGRMIVKYSGPVQRWKCTTVMTWMSRRGGNPRAD